jgi:ribosomal protein S9
MLELYILEAAVAVHVTITVVAAGLVGYMVAVTGATTAPIVETELTLKQTLAVAEVAVAAGTWTMLTAKVETVEAAS